MRKNKRCATCGNDLIYIKNERAKELGYKAMQCINCKRKFLIKEHVK